MCFFGPRFEQAPQGKTKQKTRVMLVLFSGPGSGTAPYGEQLNPRILQIILRRTIKSPWEPWPPCRRPSRRARQEGQPAGPPAQAKGAHAWHVQFVSKMNTNSMCRTSCNEFKMKSAACSHPTSKSNTKPMPPAAIRRHISETNHRILMQ